MNRIILITTFFILIGSAAFAQKTFNKCTYNNPLKVYNKDTVYIACDTVYMLSKEFYKNYFKNVANQNDLQRTINKIQKQYIADCDSQVTRKDNEYNALKLKFDSLSTKSSNLARNVETKLNTIDSNLDTVSRNITDAKKSIEEASDYIKKEQKASFLKRLAWGASGFGIGIVTTALIVVATK